MHYYILWRVIHLSLAPPPPSPRLTLSMSRYILLLSEFPAEAQGGGGEVHPDKYVSLISGDRWLDRKLPERMILE